MEAQQGQYSLVPQRVEDHRQRLSQQYDQVSLQLRRPGQK